jgi:PAS domain S-box-containing protein
MTPGNDERSRAGSDERGRAEDGERSHGTPASEPTGAMNEHSRDANGFQAEHEETALGDNVPLRAIFDQAAVGIALAELDGRFVAANKRFRQILGYGEEELQRVSVIDITHPEDLADTRENMRRLTSGVCNEYVQEKRYVRKDRSAIWSRTTVTLLRNGTGEGQRYIGVIEDITAAKQLE